MVALRAAVDKAEGVSFLKGQVRCVGVRLARFVGMDGPNKALLRETNG